LAGSVEEELEVEMGRGADEEMKVVDVEDGESEEAAPEGSAKETRMLPRMPLRVLLAEGDDSTRHVISALLRKCGYRGEHCLRARQFLNRIGQLFVWLIIGLGCIGSAIQSDQYG
jgi:hypothetical protein